MNNIQCTFCEVANTPESRFCAGCGKPLNQPTLSDTSPPIGSPHSAAEERIPSIGVNRTPMPRRVKLAYGIGTAALFSLFLWMFFSHLPGQPNPVIAQQPDIALPVAYAGDPIHQTQIEALVRDGDVIISLPTLLDKKMVAFDYAGTSTKIPLLAYINSTGKLVTAFRYCEPCNSETYRIEGVELCCGKCESKWKLDNLDGIQGSCMKYPPNPIPSTVVGNEIHISEALVKSWKTRL